MSAAHDPLARKSELPPMDALTSFTDEATREMHELRRVAVHARRISRRVANRVNRCMRAPDGGRRGVPPTGFEPVLPA
jgi:hypothetical protein